MKSAEPTLMTSQGGGWNPYQSTTVSIEDGTLVCTHGPHQGLRIELQQELLQVGRDDWCHISLSSDPRVSRHHCELRLTEKGIHVRDLESRNGTAINGIRVYEAMFVPGTQLQIGDCVFALESGGQARNLQIDYHDKSGLLVGKSAAMRKIFSLLERVGPSMSRVLLRGETGTGKTTVARALHEHSARMNEPFVHVNCGALSPSLVEAELFGYEKGAFTGAGSRHKGYFEQANGGTLFLDEIGELPIELQPKLLDVIERQVVRRLGGESETPIDIRLVTATHRDLREAVREKRFRQDLYYRIAVCELQVPPLRERREDIGLLVDYMFAQSQTGQTYVLTEAAIRKLQSLLWPGNVRQLHNVIETTMLFADQATIDADDLVLSDDLEPYASVDAVSEQAPVGHVPAASFHSGALPDGSLRDLLAVEEKRILLTLLEGHAWDVEQVHQRLDISRSGLYHRMKKHGIKR